MAELLNTSDVLESIADTSRQNDPSIRFAHEMLNSAGFSREGLPLASGPIGMPDPSLFADVGVPVPEPEPAQPAQEPPDFIEQARRVGVQVLRAPADVVSSTLTQIANLTQLAAENTGQTLAFMAQLTRPGVFRPGVLQAGTFDPAERQAAGRALAMLPGLPQRLARGAEDPQDLGDALTDITNQIAAMPETGIERVVSDVARFTTGMIPVIRGLRALGTSGRFATTMEVSGVTDFFAIDPDTPSIIESVGLLSPELQDFVRTYIRSPRPDPDAEMTFREQLTNSGFRAMFDGAVFTALFEGFLGTVRLLRHGVKVKTPFAQARGEFEAAERAAAEGEILPMLQEAAREGPRPRALPVGRGGPTVTGFPPAERAPIRPTEQLALPPGAVRLQLAEGRTPVQVVDEVFETLAREVGRSTPAEVVTALEQAATQLKQPVERLTEMFRIGQKMLERTGGRRLSPLEAESGEAFFRRLLGPDDEATRNLVALLGLTGAAGAGVALGIPTDETTLTNQLNEAGIGSTLVRALARRLSALGRGLETAAQQGLRGAAREAAPVRQLVHDPAIVTEAAEEPITQATRQAAREFVGTTPTRVTAAGVRKDIHFGKIDTDEDVRSLLQHFSDAFEPEIAAGRRLGTPMAQEANLARSMGMTVEDLHAFADTAQILPKVAAAANEMLVASGTRLDALRQAVLAGDVTAEAEYLKQFQIHGSIQRSVGTIRAESGRTLGMYRLNRSGNIELLHGMSAEAQRRGAKTGMSPRQLAEADALLTPAQRTKLARDMTKPNAGGALLELWMNSILSGPKTVTANLSGSLYGMLMAPTERAMSAQYSKLYGGDIVAGEATEMIYGMLSTVMDALSLGAKTFRTGIPRAPGTRAEMPRLPQFTAEAFRVDPTSAAGAFINGMGHIIRTPGRVLMATDDAMKLILYQGEMRAQALRAAKQQDIPTEQLDTFLTRFLADPPESAMQAGTQTRDVYTFTNALSDPTASFQTVRTVGIAVQMASLKHPLLKLVAPFVRTPVNLMTVAGERTPVINLLSSTFRRQLMSSNPNVRAEAMTKLTLSGMVMGLAATLSASGMLTGSLPKNPALLARARDLGLQANSIRIGDTWVNLNRADPIGGPLLVAADLAAVMGLAEAAGIPSRDMTTLTSQAVLSFMSLFVDKTYMRGISRLMDAVRGGSFGESKLDAAQRIGIDTLTGGLVPNLAVEFRRTIDPARREMETAIDRLWNRIPGLSRTLPALTNDWGDPVRYGYGLGPGMVKGLWNFFAPFNVTKIAQHASAQALADNQIPFRGPSRLFQGIELTLDEHNAYKKTAGDLLRGQFERAMDLPIWARLTPGPDGGKARLFRRFRDTSIRQAQAVLLRDTRFNVLERVRVHRQNRRLILPDEPGQQPSRAGPVPAVSVGR